MELIYIDHLYSFDENHMKNSFLKCGLDVLNYQKGEGILEEFHLTIVKLVLKIYFIKLIILKCQVF